MGNAISRRNMIGGAVASAAVLTSGPLRAVTPAVHKVAIQAFTFEPALVQVHLGDRIRWTNHDLASHTATADGFGWDTEEIAMDGSSEIDVTEDMETSYFCAFHPHMKGTIQIL